MAWVVATLVVAVLAALAWGWFEARWLRRRIVEVELDGVPPELDGLPVFENVDFFGGLFGHPRAERRRRIARLLRATGLAPFADRPAGKLSGGMRQKLGLCCALVHDPDLLILDEPTTGVDPLSRRQFWQLMDRIRSQRPGMSLLIARAYMEEAARVDWLLAMNRGTVLGTGTPRELLARSGSETLEEAFVRMLPGGQGTGYRPVEVPPRDAGAGEEIAIEARDLTMRFGDFTAVVGCNVARDIEDRY